MERAGAAKPPLFLFSEQIGMCSGPVKVKIIALNTINQQPVRKNVTFLMIDPLAAKRMVSVPGRKRRGNKERLNHSVQQIHIIAPFDAAFTIPLEQGGDIEIKHHLHRRLQRRA